MSASMPKKSCKSKVSSDEDQTKGRFVGDGRRSYVSIFAYLALMQGSQLFIFLMDVIFTLLFFSIRA